MNIFNVFIDSISFFWHKKPMWKFTALYFSFPIAILFFLLLSLLSILMALTYTSMDAENEYIIGIVGVLYSLIGLLFMVYLGIGYLILIPGSTLQTRRILIDLNQPNIQKTVPLLQFLFSGLLLLIVIFGIPILATIILTGIPLGIFLATESIGFYLLFFFLLLLAIPCLGAAFNLYCLLVPIPTQPESSARSIWSLSWHYITKNFINLLLFALLMFGTGTACYFAAMMIYYFFYIFAFVFVLLAISLFETSILAAGLLVFIAISIFSILLAVFYTLYFSFINFKQSAFTYLFCHLNGLISPKSANPFMKITNP